MLTHRCDQIVGAEEECQQSVPTGRCQQLDISACHLGTIRYRFDCFRVDLCAAASTSATLPFTPRPQLALTSSSSVGACLDVVLSLSMRLTTVLIAAACEYSLCAVAPKFATDIRRCCHPGADAGVAIDRRTHLGIYEGSFPGPEQWRTVVQYPACREWDADER